MVWLRIVMGPSKNVSSWLAHIRARFYRPVTPAIHKGWAPMIEKMNDAIKEERRTSDTPYCWVDSIKCNENAMPGSTLTTWWSTHWSESSPRAERRRSRGGNTKERKMETTMKLRQKTYFAKKTRAVAGSTL
jgi:hypothetical protein